ncbi:MAG TPA: hypothetical protein VJ385_03580 [Fibrobacteria bacterium]|nr:hypothetical protein [Fibrobacteria bacterium]
MRDGQMIVEGREARGRKCVSGSEPFVLGHYPETPIYPGVLSIDLIVGAAEALVRAEYRRECRAAQISRIQFLDMSRPGDVLEIKAAVKKEESDGIVVTGAIEAGGKAKMRGTVRVRFL